MRKILSICLIGLILAAGIVYAEQIVRIAPLTYSIKSTTTTVGGIATAIPATALVGRENIAIYNVDSATETVWIGASDVTSANGFPLTSSCPAITLDIDDSVIIYAISDGTNVNIRTLEAK
jgi:hypothetical protein